MNYPSHYSMYKYQALTPAQSAIIAETVPLLKQAGETLAANFYKNMLGNYPEVRPFFNKADQVTMRQPKILAFALLRYAENISDLTVLSDFVAKIVHKHVGLQVRPQYYPIVGSCILETMQSLLGPEIATAAFLEAWAIAYGNLALILINAEQDAYNAAEKEHGAWQGFKEFVVCRLVEECQDVRSVYFSPKDPELAIAKALPGQYICIRWGAEGADDECSREYSLLQTPSANQYRISVRLVPGGDVSNRVHKSLKVGDVVRIAPPAGDFTYLQPETLKPVLFLAGGIGITPLLPMMKVALHAGQQVTLYNCNRDKATEPFQNELAALAEEFATSFTIKRFLLQGAGEQEATRLSTKHLDSISTSSDVYMVGPRPFMREYKTYFESRGIAVKLEYFGPMDLP